MSTAGLNAPKRSCCPPRKSIALCERNRSSLLPDVMISLSKHVCTFINISKHKHRNRSWRFKLECQSLPEGSFEVEIMASTSRASRKRVEDAEIFQVLEEKKKFDNNTFYQGNKLYSTYRKFLGKMASYLFRQFFQPHKSYENAVGTRNVQLWHYKGKQKKIYQQNL